MKQRQPDIWQAVSDVREFKHAFWPDARFYDREWDIVDSVRTSLETISVAGNKLGKDFTAGWIAPAFFLRPQLFFEPAYVAQVESWRKLGQYRDDDVIGPHTRRVVTTSVKDEHLDVLWAEIGNWLAQCKVPLLREHGGPLIVNHHEVRFAFEAGREGKNLQNYLKGMVSQSLEGGAGHHAAYTLLIGDEASGLSEATKRAGSGWAKRFLWIGNPEDCQNFFRAGVEAGDLRVA